MDDMRLEPGTVLAEKYRLESVLGTGGMGTVYRAEHLALRAPVAIKVIDREVSEGDLAFTRFMNEAQAAASLRSPHVVQILDYGTDGDRPFMVMEMLEGEPLADRLDRMERLTPEETYRVISHVAKAVAKAHEADIIHRDLKPDNVFMVHNEGDEVAKVLDFGVAKVEATALDGEGHTRTGSLLGTPYYMSPEQAQGNKDIDARSDLWALGVIAFECLTGKRPFSSDGLGDLVLQICIRDIPRPSDHASVPAGFDDWFFRACEREPEDRFQSARELSEALRSALGLGGEVGSIPESRWSAAAQMPSKRFTAQKTYDAETRTTQPDEDDEQTIIDEAPAPRTQMPSETLMEGTDPGEARSRREGRPSHQSARAEQGSQSDEARGSQWQVVPHGSVTDEELNQASIPVKKQGSSVLFVAITALLVGGAVVFGMKQAGVDLSGEDSALAPRLTPPPQKQKAKPRSTTKNRAKSATQAKAKATGLKSGEAAADGQAADTEASQEEDTELSEEEKAALHEEGVAPAEGDSLEAIEDAAQAAVDEREQGEEDANVKEPTPAGEESKETPGPGPALPAGLAPTPAPPAPPAAPQPSATP